MARRTRAVMSSPIAKAGFVCRGWIFEGIGGKRKLQGRPWAEWMFRHEDGRQISAVVPEGWQHTEMAVVDRAITLDMMAREQILSREYARMC